MTAKLRHIAVSVPDLKRAAEFYKSTFGLEEVNYVETPYGDGLSLSDGVINLTLLKFHTATLPARARQASMASTYGLHRRR